MRRPCALRAARRLRRRGAVNAKPLLYPALVVAVFAGTGALLDTDLPRPAASGLALASVLALVLALERLTPLHPAWNRRPEGADLALLALNRLVDVGLAAGLLALLGALEARGLPRLHVWPTQAPLWAQACLGILVAEGIRYGVHRASHRPGLLWRWHRVHHQPERMYALNGPRLHPANYAWVAAAHQAPMLLLGASVDAVVVAATVTAFFVVFQHANVALPFGGWNRLLATPDVHRLHHARRGPAEGVNHGVVVLLYDHLFGTYRGATEELPADAIGLQG